MQPLKCILYFYSNAMHLEQLYTGLASLVLQQKIVVTIKANNHPQKAFFMQGLGANFFKLRIENGPMLLFDVHDNLTLYDHDGLLDDVDFYFKRSYSISGYDEQQNGSNKKFKVLPLGFNYSVYGSNNFLLQRVMLQQGFKKKVEWFSRGNVFLAGLLKLNTSIAYANEKHMHQLPVKRNPRILLMTRLWSTDSVKEEHKKEIRHHLNGIRTSCIRALKKEFKENFTGGLFIDEFSKKTAPDALLASNELAAKPNYLKQLKQHNIGVTVNGRFSAGWSFGENIAFSNAIVADGLTVKVPGSFSANKNFMDFENADGCVTACGKLFSNHHLIEEMQHKNLAYYNEFLRPDMLVWNAIVTAMK